MGKDINWWFPKEEIGMASKGEMSNLMSNKKKIQTKIIMNHFFICFKLGEIKKVYTT